MTPPPRKILMTTDAVGGVWIFSTTLAKELCRRGFEVTLVTLGPPPREHQVWALNGVDGLRLEITDLALEWMDPGGHDLPRAQFRLAALERRIEPELVHLNGYREACLHWRAPSLLTAHSCVRSWWIACRGREPNEARWDHYIANVRAGLAAADLWVAPSRAFCDTIEALYQPPRRGHVVWNGIEPLSPGKKEPFVLAAGRIWDEAKNIGVLSSIAAELPWPVRVAGASQFPGVTEIGAQSSAAERIGELERDRLLEQMRCAAIFAASPLYEPFGLTILEAAASGCALALADIPTLRELWDGAALFADARDRAGFAEALKRLCNDQELRERLQLAARRRAAEFTLAASADGYCELYACLLPGREAQPSSRQACGPATEARP